MGNGSKQVCSGTQTLGQLSILKQLPVSERSGRNSATAPPALAAVLRKQLTINRAFFDNR
jgi:hypothetical protein